MARQVPSSSRTRDWESFPPSRELLATAQVMADLKVFWGPEICRLEYLVHLLDTGRIKDEYWPASA